MQIYQKIFLYTVLIAYLLGKIWLSSAADDDKKDKKKKEKKMKDPTQPDVKPLKLTVIGCFKDKGGKNRPFPYVKHQINFFVYNDWNNMTEHIKNCRDLVRSKSYKYFGMQYFGECWYGPPLRVNYKKDGKAMTCLSGAGIPPSKNETGSLVVYRINGT